VEPVAYRQKIIERLESKNLKEPWIYYIHLNDLHPPHTVPIPEEFDNEKYGNNEYEKRVSIIDLWIGKFLQRINLERTLIVLTADHGDYVPITNVGHDIMFITPLVKIARKIQRVTPKLLEPFGVKGFLFLRNLLVPIQTEKLKRKLTSEEMRTLNVRGVRYDDMLRVPLIFVGYGINSSTIISQMVRQIDIFPTVKEIIGLTEATMNVSGRSLYPLFKGERLEELPVYIENDHADSKKPGNLIGLRTSNYKYYRARKSPRKKINLYDLKNDPNEKNNIATKRPDVVDEMEKILTELKRNIPSKQQTQEITGEETKKIEDELRKLGYI